MTSNATEVPVDDRLEAREGSATAVSHSLAPHDRFGPRVLLIKAFNELPQQCHAQARELTLELTKDNVEVD
jgi:hypothetical protein